jgi:hypothetical protein
MEQQVNTDQALADARSAHHELMAAQDGPSTYAEVEAAHKLAHAFGELDGELSGGGKLPAAWITPPVSPARIKTAIEQYIAAAPEEAPEDDNDADEWANGALRVTVAVGALMGTHPGLRRHVAAVRAAIDGDGDLITAATALALTIDRMIEPEAFEEIPEVDGT